MAADLNIKGWVQAVTMPTPTLQNNIADADRFGLALQETANGENLTISQTDLDSLIRSKAAMYTILETLSSTVGVAMEDLDAFYVAGTFGSYIKPQSAITIGMLPDLPQERFHSLGNSSLGGADNAAVHCCNR